jgi:hypothetical protein
MNDVNSVIYAVKILHKTLKKWEFYNNHYHKNKKSDGLCDFCTDS